MLADPGLHLRICGGLLIVLGLAHAWFPRHFGWHEELRPVTLFARQVFFVHNFFIGLTVTLMGLLALAFAGELLQPSRLAAAVLAGITLFWFSRLVIQFFGYDRSLWRGNAFHTRMHILFTFLWSYLTLVFGWACARHMLP